MAARKRKARGKKKSVTQVKTIAKMEKRIDWRAILMSTAFNLVIVLIAFVAAFTNFGKVLTGFYFSLILLGFTATISIFAWIVWTFRRIEQKRLANIVSLAMVITLIIMLNIIHQAVALLGTLV